MGQATLTEPRRRLAALLAGVGEEGSPSASATAPTDGLRLEVRGLGPIRLPLSEAQAKKLCKLGRPARYGRGTETLVDPAVRDTWEIPKSRVKIDKRRWNATLMPVVDRLRAALGLPESCVLDAELHSLLVYAPGQFFVPHQDSEKEDGMVGSLVVTLPSSFTGGALEVAHEGVTATYRGSKKYLSFVAFYSDCHHQVKPVKSGHRVVLTYNLLLRGDSSAAPYVADDPRMVEELAECLEGHFKMPSAPKRLVYLLDHEYTQRGLGWSLLKGADAGAGAMLRAASERAECEAVLALADVHEMWSAYGEFERGYGRSRRYSWYDDEDDDDDDVESGSSGDYQLEELIESTVTIESWLVSSGPKTEKVDLVVDDDEVCSSIDSDDLTPYSTQYMGYMGNWGNTLDRWYHRGAVMLWPQSLAFAVRAEASPGRALDALCARVKRGDLAGAQEDALTLLPFWDQVARRVEGADLFTKTLRAAKAVEAPTTASMLLKPFRPDMVSPSHAASLGPLVDAYGDEWADDVVRAWATKWVTYHHGCAPVLWIATIDRLCRALVDVDWAGRRLAALLLRESWKYLSRSIEVSLDIPRPSDRSDELSDLARPLAALMEAASVAEVPGVTDEAVQLLCRDSEDLVRLGIEVLRSTVAEGWGVARYGAVVEHCRKALEVRLAQPERAHDDWSIKLPAGCECELCKTLESFLADPHTNLWEWPIARTVGPTSTVGSTHRNCRSNMRPGGRALPTRLSSRRRRRSSRRGPVHAASGSPISRGSRRSNDADRDGDERNSCDRPWAWSKRPLRRNRQGAGSGDRVAVTGASDEIDASVALLARRHGASVVTSDPDDLRRLDPTMRLVADRLPSRGDWILDHRRVIDHINANGRHLGVPLEQSGT